MKIIVRKKRLIKSESNAALCYVERHLNCCKEFGDIYMKYSIQLLCGMAEFFETYIDIMSEQMYYDVNDTMSG